MNATTAKASRRDLAPRTAMRFVVLLGFVSLFADMTYEGGRSILGPFLQQLGASATVVGVFAGLGELIGYGLRLVSGLISDRTGKYWTITIIGYAVNLVAVPALALAGSWEVAVVLMMLERTGKAVRKPARDAMLAHATQTMGRGWGFGLHEAMDQTGALIGPLIIALMLHVEGRYPPAFALLAIPAMMSFGVLLSARQQYPRPAELEIKTPELQRTGISRMFWWYALGGGLVAAGYADFPLIAYHFARHGIIAPPWIPVLYAGGMAAAGVAALSLGWLYDKAGSLIVPITLACSAAFAPLVFLGNATAAVIGMLVWGLGLGVQESVVRAALAGMVSPERRASAYGTFDMAFGIFWFAGSAAMGVLYDHSMTALVVFSVAAQIAAVPFLVFALHRPRG